jgi:hypothetical protein
MPKQHQQRLVGRSDPPGRPTRPATHARRRRAVRQCPSASDAGRTPARTPRSPSHRIRDPPRPPSPTAQQPVAGAATTDSARTADVEVLDHHLPDPGDLAGGGVQLPLPAGGRVLGPAGRGPPVQGDRSPPSVTWARRPRSRSAQVPAPASAEQRLVGIDNRKKGRRRHPGHLDPRTQGRQ